ncbi:MAG: hypothetical protein JXR76_16715 [Deltaproteobacteria bacterium]|nr:hypothetical protein [Deltaproteobacteria bacterium]
MKIEETTVFSLDENHPERQVLRDKLIKYHLSIFEGLEPDDIEGRLAEFHLALALHEPLDFRNGNVSLDAVPMAQWVVQQFEPQGKEALVLAGLTFLSMAEPENTDYQTRFTSLLDWSESVRDTIRDPIERYSSLSAMYSEAAALVPHKTLLERLAAALAGRQKAVVQFLQMFAGDSRRFSPLLFHSVISQGGIGKEFVHAWFVGDYLEEVLDVMQELDVVDGIEEELLAILSQLKHGKNLAHNYHQLAQLLGPGDPVAGMRACMRALHLAPREPRYNLCVGRFFSNMEREVAAIDFFAKAVLLDSGASLVQAMELVQDSLYRIHKAENRAEMRIALEQTEKIIQTIMDKKLEDEDVLFSASSLIETAAIIEFDDGEIDTAEKWFQMAHEFWPSRPTPVTKIAEIFYWRGDYQRAVDYLTQTMNAKDKVGGAYADYWRAMMYEQRGDCYLALGDKASATADYRLALKRWEKADYPMEQAPVISIRQGVLLSRVGDMEKSMDKFREAIRLSPDRRPSYAEIISFLVINERLEDAKEFYQLAFNQDMLAAMWKVYFSIWVDGLSRQLEDKPFDLATGYLANTSDDSWQDKLASFFIGAIDASALRKSAVNKGQQVEADYYEALLLVVGGKSDGAKKLLKNVINSNLYAFFEYRMAAVLLNRIEGNALDVSQTRPVSTPPKKNDASSQR